MLHGHQTFYVVLSIIIAVLGSWTALDLHRRIASHERLTRLAWLVAAALAASLSIWSMHFVAMLGFNAGVPVRYDLALTLASLLLAVVPTAAAFLAVERPAPKPFRVIVAGLAMGTGICLMHYVGMAAVRAPATLDYRPAYVVASFIIAVVASWAALQAVLWRPTAVLRAVGALVLGLAIASMHYTAMMGATFTPTEAAQAGVGDVDNLTLALGVASSTLLLLFLALVAAMFDRRFEVMALREAKASARAESEARLRAIFDTALDAIIVTDEAGAIQSVNPAASRIFGYTPDDLVNWDVRLLMPDGWGNLGHSDVKPGGSTPAPVGVGREAQGRRKDGTTFPLELSIAEGRDAQGQRFFTGIVRDVSERKEAEAALRQSEARLRELNETLAERVAQEVAEREVAQAQLHEVQKLETIGQLTGGVAHDVNNLLTPIVGSLDLLQRRVTDERSQRHIAGALQAAERARVLVQRLLAFARRQTLAARAVDLPALVGGMIELIGRSIGPQIEIAVNLPGDLPPAKVDPNQFELALLNLAVNARDAMPGGGTLTLGASESTVERHEPDGLRPGRYVRLWVSDTGVGMDAGTLRRAVEPFFTTKGTGRGTGLGLSMVHGLAGQSGGALRLQSTPGKGTRAELWLPVADAAAEALPMTDDRPVQAVRAASILLVDDEELVRSATADMLSDLGYTVAQAGSGAQAIEMVRTGLRPDLLITDYAMPSMTGVELAQSVRSRAPDVPVLLITGYANLSHEEVARLPRLAKPFRQADLAAAIAELLEGNVVRLPPAQACDAGRPTGN